RLGAEDVLVRQRRHAGLPGVRAQAAHRSGVLREFQLLDGSGQGSLARWRLAMSPASKAGAGNGEKIKVAVLGGGVAALTTAFELTSTEELRAKYDVTVYQMGWRLGGKGASGRNRAVANRIEEHGLHIW